MFNEFANSLYELLAGVALRVLPLVPGLALAMILPIPQAPAGQLIKAVLVLMPAMVTLVQQRLLGAVSTLGTTNPLVHGTLILRTEGLSRQVPSG